MDLIAAAVFIILGAALVAYVASPTTARGLDTFGAGFVPYRSAGWPQGVQEEEPVHWSWSEPREPDATRGDRDTSPDSQIVEIAGQDAPVASAVHRGPITHDRTGRWDA
jgi:hypothetical protein